MPALANKVAVITGGCSGIGLATAELFVAEGARVLIADILDEPGKALASRLGSGAAFQHCDVTDEAQIAAAMQAAVSTFGALDIVFNNAGAGGALERIEDMTGELWDRTQAILLRSVALGIRHAVPFMKANGGAIVNTSSVAGLEAGTSPIAYSTAKAGVIQLGRIAAAQLSRYNIRVNTICPGLIMTDIYASGLGLSGDDASSFNAGLEALARQTQPLAVAGLPEHVAQACLYLASDHAAFVTGTQLVVDGGLMTGKRSAWDPTIGSPLQDLIVKAKAASAARA